MIERLRKWWSGIGAAWHYGKGIGAYNRGRYAKAAKAFRRSRELDPDKQLTREWIEKAEKLAKASGAGRSTGGR
jgi:Tetratricopeptide repeat